MKIEKKCIQCGKMFLFRNAPSDIIKKRGKFCSRECLYVYQDKREIKKCENCGKLGKWKRNYCSLKCYWATIHKKYSGKNSFQWKGGIAFCGNRVYIRIAKRKYISYAKYVTELHLGKKLKKYEIVHHIDEDPSNDLLENLYVFTRKKHTRHHKLTNSPKLISNIYAFV